MRRIYYSREYELFKKGLSEKIQEKLDFAESYIIDNYLIHSKLIKKIVNSDFYELRISSSQEYRILVYCLDKDNFMLSKEIILLNGFIKKSNKDYKKAILKAEKLLKVYYEKD